MNISEISDFETRRKLTDLGFEDKWDINSAQRTSFKWSATKEGLYNGFGKFSSGTKYTPLGYAASIGDLDLIEGLIKASANIDRVDPHNETPLMLAVRNGKADAAKLLIESGANQGYVKKKKFKLISCGNNPDVNENMNFKLDQGKYDYGFFGTQFAKYFRWQQVDFDATEEVLKTAKPKQS